MLDNRFKQIVDELYSIPNAPFSIKLRTKYITTFLEKSGFEFEDTPYYIKASLNKVKDGNRIFFISHLDHPGFIFKNNRKGIAFGSLYLHQGKEYKPISIFSPKGIYIGDAKLLKAYGRDESKVSIQADFPVPINSQGLWNVGNVKFDEEKIYGRSHDNDIATALMLYNIGIAKNTEYEIVYVFTKHEEVLQQSSFNIAKNNSLNITSKDMVINLESMKVYSTTNIDKYSKLDYFSGPVLNISETTTFYSKTNINLAESLVNNISNELKIRLQRGLSGGTSDSRPISELNLTNNIVTLNIPNEFKHNSDGEIIRAEEILIKDVNVVSELIEKVIKSKTLSAKPNINDISQEISKETIVKIESQSYLGINQRLDLAFRNIVKRGYYYPTSIIEYIKDIFWKVASYSVYLLQSSKRNIHVSKK